ncbi:MAG: hypothetical protein JXD22_00650 [Sedimentisphaerales bacterium]|nr:hypothetical protein [Sedimentisphaerales bacterium]
MTEAEQIQYLANVFHVARSDGKVDPVEDKAVEQMAKDIGAGYFQTRKALDMAGQADFKVVFPARLSERIRNMEDMLFVAGRDVKLEEVEKEIVVDFARQIGVNQQQVDMIRRETRARLKKVIGKKA